MVTLLLRPADEVVDLGLQVHPPAADREPDQLSVLPKPSDLAFALFEHLAHFGKTPAWARHTKHFAGCGKSAHRPEYRSRYSESVLPVRLDCHSYFATFDSAKMQEEKPHIIEFNVSHDARLVVSRLSRKFIGDGIVQLIYGIVDHAFRHFRVDLSSRDVFVSKHFT